MKLTNNHYRKRLSKKLTSSALVPFFVIGASTVIAADQVNQSYIIENAKTGKDWPTHGLIMRRRALALSPKFRPIMSKTSGLHGPTTSSLPEESRPLRLSWMA